MSKIKIAMVVKDFELHGISRVITNYCEHLNKEKYQVVVLAGEPINEGLRLRCEGSGTRIVALPNKKNASIAFYHSLFKQLKSEDVNIVHVHGSSATIAIEIIIAALLGIRHRIAHSHSTSGSNLYVHKLLRPILNMVSTKAIACSSLAGKWLFDRRPFEVLYNGIDMSRFALDRNMRVAIRTKLAIDDDELVIGHVGRINRGKNQEFLIRVFDDFLKLNPNARLLMVGTGPDELRIKDIVSNDENKSKIIMYGATDCVSELYSAMDVFVFPSKHEGLPLTLIEAQANGLACIVSDAVTDEVLVCDKTIKLSLNLSAAKWAETVRDVTLSCDREYRLDRSDSLKLFDEGTIILQLEAIYDQIMGF